MIDDGKLDAMLSAPLEAVADDGFSADIAHRIGRQDVWSERLVWGIPAFAACALAPFLPLREFTDTFLGLGPAIAGSTALSLAAAALVLTISFEQRFRDWQSAL
jgi:predicted cobalt transporter CbtA